MHVKGQGHWKMISVVGMPNTNNFGDPILLENTVSLIKSVVPDENINIVDLELGGLSDQRRFFYKLTRKVLSIFLNKKSLKYYKYLIYIQKVVLKNFYIKKLERSKVIIFAGGGLIKYSYQEVGMRVALIVEIAKELNIPVMLNAAGVEGYNGKHPTAVYLKDAINNGTVKVITTRDDLKTLTDNYLETNSNIRAAWVPDSAWWSDVTYNVNVDVTKNNTIGIGLIRKGIFRDNGLNFSDDQSFEFWRNICNELNHRGIKFEFFTNGVGSDSLFVDEFMSNNPQFSNVRVRIPRNAEELISIISTYDRIFACRMHASIVAYSLGIPSIAIQWSNKLKMFYEQINHVDRIINTVEMEKMSSNEIINILLNATYSKKDLLFKEKNREITRTQLKCFLNEYL